MYADRMRTLMRAYNSAEKNNKAYRKAMEDFRLQETQLSFLEGLQAQIKALDLAITTKESEWREAILSVLEAGITEDLSWVYPTDGYRVSLSTKVSRGKIHIEAKVSSVFAKDIPGRIKGTQGRLFQQVVSIATLKGVMALLGIKTIYVDEAFSGSSKRNIQKLNRLLAHLGECGYNLILIAQDTSMAEGISANRLFLSRSVDNKTSIAQEVVTNGSEHEAG